MVDVLHALGGFRRPELDARLWVVTTAELVAHGVTQRQIEHLVRIGLLHRIHRGVYAVGRPHLAFDGRCRAAVLACGPGSGISHVSSGGLWRFAQPTDPIHVSVPRGRRSHAGLILHHPRELAEDLVERHGVVRTSVARTMLDLAVGADERTLGRWIHEAGVQGVLVKSDLWTVIERHRRHRGAAVLEAALATEFLPTRSGLEDLMLDLAHDAGLPRPAVNEELWSGVAFEEVDCSIRELGLIIEVDSCRYHWSRWRRRQDAAKKQRFEDVGWCVRRIHELEMTLQPAIVIRRLRVLEGELRRSPPRVVSEVHV